jgi:YegS/Rv2252/BmrU family lipid kinase
MRVVAIINPVSGAGMDPSVATARVKTIRDELTRRGVEAAIVVTERAGHAREIAERAASDHADLVIVWGGDGTVNEVGGALAGTPTPLGLIPAGSGNGLAAGLAVPRAPMAAIAKALGDQTLAIDAGMFNGRHFFNVAGIGFDAHIATLFNQRPRGRRGRLPYIVIGVREGCRYTSSTYKVTLDGSSVTSRALLIAFANGSEYGMGVKIAPHAQLNDGRLEACIVEDRPVVSRFIDARHLALGSIQRAPKLVTASIQRATVEADRPIAYHLDGEPGIVDGRVEISIKPGALRVKV